MFKWLIPALVLHSAGCFVGGSIVAQPGGKTIHSSLEESRMSYVTNFHDSVTASDTRLVNGRIYTPVYQGVKNHPYYNSNTWDYGTVYTNEATFSNIPLRYDLYNDQPLYLTILSQGAYMLALNRDNIRGFVIHQSRFTHLDPKKKSPSKNLPAGYYQVLHRGDIADYYIRWSKYRKENMGFEPDEFVIERINVAKVDGHFFTFQNRRGLIKIFPDLKKEIKSYLRDNTIYIRRASPSEICSIFSYLETLKAKQQ